MASAAEAPSNVRRIELEEEEEGPRYVNNDYFFHRIGKPIRILQSSSSSPFDLQNPPSRPLAVSESHLFLAHSSGFCVARSKDVIDEAARLTGSSGSASPCVQQLSIVDVPIADVHILSLSSDSSTLAVAVAGNLHFFSVISLLNNAAKPSFSCSLTGPSTIKDIQWRTTSQNSCLVLSSDCKLHHAAPDGPLKHVMDNVDAVAWSVKGAAIAIARENKLIFLSTKFKERSSMSLPFNSWGGIVKVDCIKWVRVDSIVIGCYQHSADGMEENYLLQVIRSKDGKITDAASKLGVLSFYDLFSGLIDDIVPYGSGPYLFLSYLEHSGIAIVANRKNTDQHIMLLGWSVGKTETAVLDIDRDTCLPRIELQDSGDDNLIMGLCVDNVSVHGKVKVEVGLDEHKEVFPLCVLMCVTLEGKLVMFHVASRTGNEIPPVADSVVHDEEEAFPFEVPDGHDDDNISPLFGKQKPEALALGIEVQNSSEQGSGINKGSGIYLKRDLKPSNKEEVSTEIVVDKMPSVDTPDKNHMAKHVFNHQSLPYEQPRDLVPVLQQGINGKQLLPLGKQSTKFDQSSFRTTGSEGPGLLTGQAEWSEAQKFGIGETLPASFSANASGNLPSQLQLRGNIIPEKSESKSSLSQPANKGSVARITAANSFRDYPGKPAHLSDVSGQLTSVDPARPTQIGRVGILSGVGKLESLPSIRTQLSVQDGLNQRSYGAKEKIQSISNAVPNMTIQFGSIQEMVKELDMLLDGIQEKGGFRDACTVSLRSSIEALETGIRAFSRNCVILKGMMDNRLEEIQCLLDNTIQVLARKTYMEGIVKRTSDSKYWELWDRQKLSPELELKRQHIWELNQDLMTKLVELERHFNTLELQQFGENAGHSGQSAVHNKYGPSRQMQSVHSLCNTTKSQIAAAEQLSDCLSKQMAVLQIQSPVKQKNIKKELFETIGIPYDASFSSPDADKADHTSPSMRPILSGSVTSKHQSRRRHSGALKGFESESARRRRDSLDQSWTSFEPTKTTVKRVLLQDNHESVVRKSSMLMDRRDFGPRSLDGPGLPPLEDDTSSNFLQSSDMEYPLTSQGTGSGSSMLRGNSTASFSVGSVISPIVGQNRAKETDSMPAANDSSSRGSGFEKYGNLNKKSAPATVSSSGIFSFQKPFEIPFTQGNAALPSSPVINMKPGPESARRLPFDSVARAAPNSLGRSTQFIKNQFDDKGPSLGFTKQLSVSPSQTSSPPSIPSMSSAMSLNTTATSCAKAVGPLVSGSSVSIDARSSRFDSAPFAAPNLFSNSKIDSGEDVQPLGSSIQFPVSSPQALSQLNVSSLPSARSSLLPMSTAAMSHGTSMSSSMANNDATLLGSSISWRPVSPAPVSSAGNLPLTTTKKPSSLSETASSLVVASPTSVSPQLEVQPTQYKTLSCATQIEPQTAPGESTSVEGVASTLQLDKTKVQPTVDKSLPCCLDSTSSTLDSSTAEIQRHGNEFSTKPDVIAETNLQNLPSLGLKSELRMLPTPAAEAAVSLTSSHHSAFGEMSATPASSASRGTELQKVSQAQSLFQAPAFPNNNNNNSVRVANNEGLDAAVSGEDEMEEEAPETSHTDELSSFGTLGGFGIGSTPGPVAPRGNPFGSPFGTNSASSSSFTMTVPSGELFQPASFSFQSPLLSQPPQSANNVVGGFSGGFGAAGTGGQSPTQSTFGQPAQVGAGQQALGTVLGSFGQSRQLGGPVLPGGGFGVAPGSSAFGGFANNCSIPAGGGFSGAATGGGFANLAKSGGSGFGGLGSTGGGTPSGFGGLASAGGSTPSGFGGLASAGAGGFGGSGGAAASGGGGGFGAFGSQQGGGGFGAFGSQQGSAFSVFGGAAGGGAGKLPELFTNMRK